jgi:hypothetical protein
VEWTGPSPANATALSWRDWGSQFRTPAPHPNLAAPPVVAAYVSALRPALARVAAWHASLPPGRGYLLAGVKLSEEVNVGPNFYFYPGGNAYLHTDPADDPTVGIAGAAQLGYAAVCTAGLAPCDGSGAGGPTPAQLDAVVQALWAALGQAALDAGLPRGKLLAHVGADFGDLPPGRAWNSGAAAVTPLAAPAFSVYRLAADPAAAGPLGLDAALDALGGGPWALGEWYLMAPGAPGNATAWAAAFAASLAYRNARAVHVFNWEALQHDAGGLAGLRAALAPAAAPACLVEPPAGLAATVSVNASTSPSTAAAAAVSVTLSWAAGPLDATAAHADVSTLLAFLPSGALAVPDVVAAAPVSPAPADGRLTFAVPPGYAGATLYASLVATGCPDAAGRPQAMASDVLRILLPAAAPG